MKINDKTVLVCDCGGTMTIDAEALARASGSDEAPTIHTALCRRQITAFEQALETGEAVLVGCAQEAPLFAETADASDSEADLAFTGIRESAGWGRDAAEATPKIAALLAAAAVEVPGAPAISFESAGVTLVYGHDASAIDLARQLAGRLDVLVLLTGQDDVVPPRVTDVPIQRGTVVGAQGHLGAFTLTIDGYAAADPSARHMLAFDTGRDGVEITADLILDLSGRSPLFRAPETRDGYFRPAPGNPALVQRALFELVDLVGSFDKPRYVAYDQSICAHARSRQTGCTKCLDLCPTGAITPDGDGVAIDPYICGGCGACAGACPTGAANYAMPIAGALHDRLRALLVGYHDAGGGAPVLLIHDTRAGEDALAAIGRFGGGLPANLLPFAVNEVGQVGLDLLLAALAHGAARVLLLGDARRADAQAGLPAQIEIADKILSGLGYGTDRLLVIDEPDPTNLEERLWQLAEAEAIAPGRLLAIGSKRDRQRLALEHLHAHAPAPVDRLALPAGAPFGSVRVNAAGCTMCLACIGACPTGALRDHPDQPQLGFEEQACIQCGLCRTTCPESVITLVPRLDCTDAVRRVEILNQEEPFACVRCGKPFGVASTVEQMVAKLADHPMFADNPAALDRIRMCEDCRVAVQFEQGAPMTGPPRPKPRTADDIDPFD